MNTVVLDARDAFGAPLRGWGRHVLGLVEHLPVALGDDLMLRLVRSAHDADAGRLAARAPEIVFEQIGLARIARRAGAALVHAPNCFLPLRRSCPGVVTVHDLAFEAHPEDFSRRTGAKYRWITPRAARSAQAVICVSAWTADDVVTPLRRGRGRRSRSSRTRRHWRSASARPGSRRQASRTTAAPTCSRSGTSAARKTWRGWRRRGRRCGVRKGSSTASCSPGPVSGRPTTRSTGSSAAATSLTSSSTRCCAAPRRWSIRRSTRASGSSSSRRWRAACRWRARTRPPLPETAGGAAVLFDPLDVDAIAAAILDVIARAQDLGHAGQQVAGAYSWERTARETADVYREVLST